MRSATAKVICGSLKSNLMCPEEVTLIQRALSRRIVGDPNMFAPREHLQCPVSWQVSGQTDEPGGMPTHFVATTTGSNGRSEVKGQTET